MPQALPLGSTLPIPSIGNSVAGPCRASSGRPEEGPPQRWGRTPSAYDSPSSHPP